MAIALAIAQGALSLAAIELIGARASSILAASAVAFILGGHDCDARDADVSATYSQPPGTGAAPLSRPEAVSPDCAEPGRIVGEEVDVHPAEGATSGTDRPGTVIGREAGGGGGGESPVVNLLLFNLAMDADDPVLGHTTAWTNALARRCDPSR